MRGRLSFWVLSFRLSSGGGSLTALGGGDSSPLCGTAGKPVTRFKSGTSVKSRKLCSGYEENFMPQNILDLTGQACPLPVIRTKEALEAGPSQEFVVVVDNEAARDNVSRFAQSRGCTGHGGRGGQLLSPDHQAAGGNQPGESCVLSRTAEAAPRTTVVVFASDRMGEGDPALGDVLMRAFCQSLVQMPVPQKHALL